MPPSTDAFSLIIVPDIQYYTDLRHKLFKLYWPDAGDNFTSTWRRQMQWAVSSRTRLNTQAVVFMGDLTQADAAEEWDAVWREGVRLLDAARPPILWCPVQGDHDLGYEYTGRRPFLFRKAASRTTGMAPLLAAAAAQPAWRGAAMPGSASAWYEVRRPSLALLLLCLEYRPRAASLRWAAGVLASHPECAARQLPPPRTARAEHRP